MPPPSSQLPLSVHQTRRLSFAHLYILCFLGKALFDAWMDLEQSVQRAESGAPCSQRSSLPKARAGKPPSIYNHTRNRTKAAITKRPGVPILSGRKAFLLHLLGSRYLFMAIQGNVLEQSNGLLDLATKF